MNQEKITQFLREQVSDLLAVYGFGSRFQGQVSPESDLDLAVLVAGYADQEQLWGLAGALEDLAGCPVDLIDLRAASTVMQYQVLTKGERWWAMDVRVGLFEAAMLSEKTAFDAARAGVLADIQQRGTVYGR